MTSAAERVLAAVDAQLEALPALLAELVRLPSVSGTPAEDDVQGWLADRFAAAGLAVEHWPLDLPALTGDPDFPGWEVPRDRAHGLLGRLPGTRSGDPAGAGARSLLLLGHADVVPPGDPALWTTDPFGGEVRDGELYGRGSCDMKGGLVAALVAATALARSGVRLAGDLLLASVVGEEDGGLGTFGLLRHGVTADACVITEPTDLDVIAANGGALTFRLSVPGRAAHGSRRTEGVSAVDKLPLLLAALADLERERNADVDPLMSRWDLAYPISVGAVRAGDWASTVPDLLVAEGRYGVALGEPVVAARATLEEAVARASAADPWLAEHPVRVEWWGGQFAPGRTDPGHPLVDATRRAHLAAAPGVRPAEVYGGPYGSDLRLLTGLGGIPTVQYGPGRVDLAHAPDERVPLADVGHVARACALLALEWCAVAEVAPGP